MNKLKYFQNYTMFVLFETIGVKELYLVQSSINFIKWKKLDP